MRRLLAPLLLALLWVGGTAAPASAHATLVSSDPAEGAVLPEAPAEVAFTFSETVTLVPNAIRAFDAGGEQVDIEPEARDEVVVGNLPDGLADGTYVIAWRVVSSDGHPIAGSLTFHVGAPSPTVQAPRLDAGASGTLITVQSGVHALDYAALLLAGGLAVFLGWTLRGVRLAGHVRRRLTLALRGSALVAVLAAAAAVPLSGAYQLGDGLRGLLDPDVLDPALVGDDMMVLALHLVGLGLAAWSADWEDKSLVDQLATGLAVWSPALVGHTQAYEPRSLLVLTDALHLSAGAVWLGGLVGLAVTLPALSGRPRDAAQVLARFTTLAAALLALLTASGVLMAWRILGSWGGLVETTYGRLLLAKLGLVAVVLAVAALNRFRLLPRVRPGGSHDQQRRGSALVRKAVVCEAALVVAVLGVTGFLAQKPPAGDPPAVAAASGTGTVTAAADDLRVLAVLDATPGRQRRLLVQVQDETGEPIDLYDAPSVSLSSETVDLGEVSVVPVAAGTYAADVVFPSAGEWKLQVGVRIDEFTSPVTTLTLDVS